MTGAESSIQFRLHAHSVALYLSSSNIWLKHNEDNITCSTKLFLSTISRILRPALIKKIYINKYENSFFLKQEKYSVCSTIRIKLSIKKQDLQETAFLFFENKRNRKNMIKHC